MRRKVAPGAAWSATSRLTRPTVPVPRCRRRVADKPDCHLYNYSSYIFLSRISSTIIIYCTLSTLLRCQAGWCLQAKLMMNGWISRLCIVGWVLGVFQRHSMPPRLATHRRHTNLFRSSPATACDRYGASVIPAADCPAAASMGSGASKRGGGVVQSQSTEAQEAAQLASTNGETGQEMTGTKRGMDSSIGRLPCCLLSPDLCIRSSSGTGIATHLTDSGTHKVWRSPGCSPNRRQTKPAPRFHAHAGGACGRGQGSTSPQAVVVATQGLTGLAQEPGNFAIACMMGFQFWPGAGLSLSICACMMGWGWIVALDLCLHDGLGLDCRSRSVPA